MSYSMPINQLLSAISLEVTDDEVISKLALDSRQVVEGTLFLAYPGATQDGRDYINEAQNSGASAVLYEAGNDYELPNHITLPAYAVNNLQTKVGLLADQFYRQPSSEMQVFGVTGTNGKTTCCYLLTQALSKLGMKAAMIGTIGVGLLDDLSASTHTTPNPVSLHELLAQWRDQGITQVCMEVSSHALAQGRVSGVQFFSAIFTNLSHDHLDYHGDMASYQAAKQKLFSDYPSELVVTNADDVMGAGLIDIANSDFITSYGINSGDVRCDDLLLNHRGMAFTIETNQIDFEVTTALIGRVNIPNILMLVATLLSLSIDIEDIQAVVADLKAAPGRMELYSVKKRPSVVVDYAHTPDALEKALQSVSEHCEGELWCVFGCGGDRDVAKRAVMGAVVERLADKAIITNDNPRSENGADIASEIASGMKAEVNEKVQIILDRAEAIATAIDLAKSQDWILLAGKGHETTQQVGDVFHQFSDRQQVIKNLGLAA